MRLTPSLPACLALSFVFSAASAADGPPPPTVSQPSGINLGGTSFYDGFAGPPGLTHQTYLKFSTSSSIRDNGGKDNRNFDNPKINVITLINQFSYYSPDTIGGGTHLGWSLLVPVVSLDGDFGDNGVKLKDNGVGLGDVTVGPQIQFDPIVNAEGRPVFVQRVAFDTILPTGKYDKHKDLNPGSNYFSFNPYWAATWMPAPRWEMSWRLNYLYNFKNDDPASSSAQVFEGQPVTAADQVISEQRVALMRIHDRAEAFAEDERPMQVASVEVIRDITTRALGMDSKPPTYKPGLYAVRHIDNWDGERDVALTFARLDAAGKWTHEETGEALLAYRGDKVLRAWPLDCSDAPDTQVIGVPRNWLEDWALELVEAAQDGGQMSNQVEHLLELHAKP